MYYLFVYLIIFFFEKKKSVFTNSFFIPFNASHFSHKTFILWTSQCANKQELLLIMLHDGLLENDRNEKNKMF